jgi:hypothetical protein
MKGGSRSDLAVSEQPLVCLGRTATLFEQSIRKGATETDFITVGRARDSA